MTKDITRDEKTLQEGGSLPLRSHVEGPDRAYGEPKGPVPGPPAVGPTSQRLVDRERDGFFGGPAAAGKGDQVGSGPEETDGLPPGAQANDAPPMPYKA